MLGTNTNDIRLNDIQIKIKTPFKRVETLMENAFLIFLNELKQFEQSSDISDTTGKTSSGTDDSTSNKFVNSKNDRQTVAFSSNSLDNNVDNFDNGRLSHNHKRNFTTLNIYVNIAKHPEVHLTLATDECYNLTVIRE